MGDETKFRKLQVLATEANHGLWVEPYIVVWSVDCPPYQYCRVSRLRPDLRSVRQTTVCGSLSQKVAFDNQRWCTSTNRRSDKG